jgi:hypothetical protein
MNDVNDGELRARFAGVRVADEHNAPDFQRVLEHANRSARTIVGRRRWLSPLALSLAAAAVIIAAVGLTRASRRAAFAAPPLSTWTSPTAGLLRTPAFDHTRPASLMSSLVDIAASTAIPRTGKHK